MSATYEPVAGDLQKGLAPVITHELVDGGGGGLGLGGGGRLGLGGGSGLGLGGGGLGGSLQSGPFHPSVQLQRYFRQEENWMESR